MFRCPAWFRNVRNRAVKTPKVHFVDSGLACHLLGIRHPEQLRSHPLRGPLFEGEEGLIGVEVESGATVASDFFTGLETFGRRMAESSESRDVERRLVFGGETSQSRAAAEVVPWSEIQDRSWL